MHNKLGDRTDGARYGLLRRLRIWRERRGNVAVLSAMLMPMFMGAAGLGVEASNWSVLETELQRTADVSALAAAVSYASSGSAHTAASAAADVAELNGMQSGERTWTAATKTLTDGLVTAQQVSGIRTASDVAFLVTVQKPVGLTFAKLFVSATSYTIPAQSTVELVSAASAQPCILALGGTSGAVTLTGTADVTAAGCSVRSDGGVTMTGNSSITAASVYAASTITTTGTATIHATKYANDGTIPDPYANYTKLQNALAQLGTCTSCSTVSLTGQATQTISPGTYKSISLSSQSVLTMQAGLYLVDGDVSVSGGAAINAGTGVTILASGSVSMSGSALTTLTAPGTSPVGGAIPGIAIAGLSTNSVSMTGTSNLVVNGVVYFPKTGVSFSGTWGNPNSPCLELIGKTVTLTGTTDLSSGGCASMGALTFGSTSSMVATLVQ
jgi:Flp pilus assembly protein TadG